MAPALHIFDLSALGIQTIMQMALDFSVQLTEKRNTKIIVIAETKLAKAWAANPKATSCGFSCLRGINVYPLF